MNSIWEKVMSSLRAQFFQRVLIQKRIAIARALLKNAPILIFLMSSVGDLSIFFFFVNAGLNLNYIGDSPGRFHRGLHKISSLFRRSSSKEDKSGNLGEPDSSPRVNLRAVNAKDIRVKIKVDDTILPSSLATTPTEDGKENRAGNGENPPKERVRNKTKKILKHAGKSVGGGIKKVMSGKSSGKSKEEVESSETERLSSVESDSSDAESQPSSVDSPPVVAPFSWQQFHSQLWYREFRHHDKDQ
ncbi:hypothetical protein KY290_032169 [Solanum tuberosum]|uniref:Uncharacterized protein n=1 Tax=Solanum tuberosum TaxID=4113 RepID=A0ABQ7UBD4_SOLTU|nr:hypothetical protein KY290_032169 [Solanum tuberosum]